MTKAQMQMRIVLERTEIQAYVGLGEEKNHLQSLFVELVMDVDYQQRKDKNPDHHQDVVCYQRAWNVIVAQCRKKHTFLEDLASQCVAILFKDKRITRMTMRLIKKHPLNMEARAGVEITQSQ